MKKFFYIIAVFAIGVTACSKNETQTLAEGASDAPVYRFSIHASIGDGTGTKSLEFGENYLITTFSSTDKVYVFLQHGSDATIGFSHNGTDAPMYLTPTDINGARCTLEGSLKFFYNDSDSFAPFQPEVGDIVYLYYNMSSPVGENPSDIDYAGCDYYLQNGSQDTYRWDSTNYSFGAAECDLSLCKMRVTGVIGNDTDGYSLSMVQYDDETQSDVHFKKQGSIFRQRLSFFDMDGDPVDLPTLTRLSVSFEGGDYFVSSYYPLSKGESYEYLSRMTILNPEITSDGDVYLGILFTDANRDKPIRLEATDIDGHLYTVVKDAPASGFENGKYYYGSALLRWERDTRPTVTGTSAEPDINFLYEIQEDPINLTISGHSEEYAFEFVNNQGGTIFLHNVQAVGGPWQPMKSVFLRQVSSEGAGDISLVLTGNNVIDTSSSLALLFYGNLKLSCTGSVATLTVTTTLESSCGFSAKNYRSDGVFGEDFNEYGNKEQLDVSDKLAAAGFNVTRSARINIDYDHDWIADAWTWTYTVRPEL